MKNSIGTLLIGIIAIGLGACGMTKPHSGYQMQSYTASVSSQNLDISHVALNAAPQKSCSFSSFHRKNAVGYEWDERTHIGLNVSPKIDVFNPSDMEVKVGLRFTMALGGSANKRPKCTYGAGYYGFVPYAMNDQINVGGLMDKDTIKSFVKEKLEIREQRRKAREAKLRL